jgi:cytoskeletal protein RodZ
MKKSTKLIIAFVVLGVLGAAGAGAALYFKQPMPTKDGKPAAADAPKKKPAKYVSLDKVIVMLRRSPGENQAHYISTDLVLSTTAEQEKKSQGRPADAAQRGRARPVGAQRGRGPGHDGRAIRRRTEQYLRRHL